MFNRLILVSFVCCSGLAAIGCNKSSTGNDDSPPSSAVGTYKVGTYSSYDSVTITLRDDNKFVTKYYLSSPKSMSADSGTYTYVGSTVTCKKAAVDIIYTLTGNQLKGQFLDTYTKEVHRL